MSGNVNMEQRWKRLRRETLLELANLQDAHSDRFMNRIRSGYLNQRSFQLGPLVYRDDLRKIWSGDRKATNRVLTLWLDQARENADLWTSVSMSFGGRLF